MIEHLSIDEWLTLDRAHPAPAAFARPYWSLALAQAFPHLVAEPVRISSAGGKPLIVPLVRDRGGRIPWRVWHGSLSGSYTCFVHEDGTAAGANETVAAIEKLIRKCDGCDITPWPLAYETDRLRLPANAKSLRQITHETSVIDLRGGLENTDARVIRISRRMARQTERRGVVCSVERGSTAVSEYYRMLEESAVRWGIGTPTLPRRLLEACTSLGADDVEIWLARAPDVPQPIAGRVVLYGSREAYGWTAAMRIKYGRFRPGDALYVAVLTSASDRGVDWFNLGSSEGLPGVAQSKRELGARTVPYITIRHSRGLLAAWERLRGWSSAGARGRSGQRVS